VSDNLNQMPLVTARNIFLYMFVLVLRLGFISLKLTAEMEDLSFMAAFSSSSQSVSGDRLLRQQPDAPSPHDRASTSDKSLYR